MGYKVKSTGIPWRISDGTIMQMACEVTFTLTGTDETVRTVTGPGINIKDLSEATWLAQIRMDLKTAIVAECQKLDAEAVETTAMTNQKTLLQTALTSSGWWFALLVAFLLWMMPLISWAGDLYPLWGTMTLVSANGGTSIWSVLRDTDIGTIDASGHYEVAIWANIEETGDNPSGTIGVSVWAVEAASGTTNSRVGPLSANEVTASEYTISAADPGVGVTKYLGTFSGVPYLHVSGARNNTADAVTINVRYRLMKGQY
ncbi:MAG: hypothetical protein HQK77_14170 [Desulfobacterales bacterium]|nr:hypothetical protein [Desulfobacterales bacterium]